MSEKTRTVWRQMTPEQRSYYLDHDKRLHDAKVAANWGESPHRRLFRQVSDKGKILEE